MCSHSNNNWIIYRKLLNSYILRTENYTQKMTRNDLCATIFTVKNYHLKYKVTHNCILTLLWKQSRKIFLINFKNYNRCKRKKKDMGQKRTEHPRKAQFKLHFYNWHFLPVMFYYLTFSVIFNPSFNLKYLWTTIDLNWNSLIYILVSSICIITTINELRQTRIL